MGGRGRGVEWTVRIVVAVASIEMYYYHTCIQTCRSVPYSTR